MAQNKKDRQKLLADRAAERLDLSIQIAETNKNVRQEIALREARIKADREKLKSVHGDLVRAQQLRLEIAQDTAAIKDLKKAQDQKNDAGKSLAFSFLQTNPASRRTSSRICCRRRRSRAPWAAGIPRPAGGPTKTLGFVQALGLQTATKIGAGARAATAGQMGTLIQVNQQILHVLERLAGGRAKHPERGCSVQPKRLL